MDIEVTSGVGDGPTALAAFDRALFAAGIANYNLIPLSSVIPPGSVVLAKPVEYNDHEWGHKLFLVIAEQREIVPGSEAWAGIGWVQDDTGAGLFVEHHGHTKHHVEAQIDQSLDSMCGYRSRTFGSIEVAVAGIECRDRPVCALVAAIYAAEGWPGAAADVAGR